MFSRNIVTDVLPETKKHLMIEFNAKNSLPIMEKKYVFICGLHRSGTTTLTNIIATSNLVSELTKTKVPKNEGQHVQSVYAPASRYGGPGKFAFNSNYHYTEESDLLTKENNDKIIKEWSKYWDLNKTILIEKSPPNIIHTRYLQEIVPNSYFIIVIRHPLPVAIATQKFGCNSIDKHIEHWLHAHEIMYNDLKKIKKFLILKYEELHIDEFENKINKFLGEQLSIDLKKTKADFDSMKTSNINYFKSVVPDDIKNKYETRINKYGYTFNYPFIL